MLDTNMSAKLMLNFKKIYQFMAFYNIIQGKRYDTIFLLSIFGSSTYRRRKLRACLESWGNSESGRCAIYAKIWIWKIFPYLTWPWPNFRQKSSLMTPLGQMIITIDIYVDNDSENLCRTSCLWLLFLVTFCDLTLILTFLSMAFVLMQYLC